MSGPSVSSYLVHTPISSEKARQSSQFINWLVDSGSSKHIVKDKSLLHAIKPPTLATVSIADGSSLNVEACGEVDLRCRNEKGRFVVLHLKDVLFVPAATHNLISMASLVHVDRYVVNIDHKSATVRKPSSQVPVPLQRVSGLFVLTSTKPPAQQLQQQQKPDTAQLNVLSTPPVGRADTPPPSQALNSLFKLA